MTVLFCLFCRGRSSWLPPLGSHVQRVSEWLCFSARTDANAFRSREPFDFAWLRPVCFLVGLGWSGFWGSCPCGSLTGPASGYYDRLWQSIGDCLALLWNLPPVILLGKDLSVAFACVGLVACSGSSVVLPFATS